MLYSPTRWCSLVSTFGTAVGFSLVFAELMKSPSLKCCPHTLNFKFSSEADFCSKSDLPIDNAHWKHLKLVAIKTWHSVSSRAVDFGYFCIRMHILRDDMQTCAEYLDIERAELESSACNAWAEYTWYTLAVARSAGACDKTMTRSVEICRSYREFLVSNFRSAR